jgi:tRNA(Arg) A34 adenosine deaminase TadA
VPGNSEEQIIIRLIDVIENDIVPLTASAVREGNKVFGSAILRKDDLSLVLAGTNNEKENPLWHGEVHTLKLFYELPGDERPDTKDCIFLATHEPCSLCLSAITWTGFDNFYYLFKYADTSETFNIPHDLKILEEVFDVHNGNYVRENAFWKSHSIVDIIASLPEAAREALQQRVIVLTSTYEALSTTYQQSKETTDIPLP